MVCICYLKQQEMNTIQQKITTYVNVDAALILKLSLLIHNYICTYQSVCLYGFICVWVEFISQALKDNDICNILCE